MQVDKILRQVPIDYYDRGIQDNLLQKIWHTHKINVFRYLIKDKDINNILDVGCASGILTSQIAKLFPNAKVTGVDLYKDAIQYAKKKYINLKFLVADAHKLPFKDNSFDLTVCYETIEHVTDPLLMIKEIHRVTKKTGISILAMDSGSLLFRIVWFVWEKSRGKVWQGAHLHPYHHHELENVIKKAGFKIIKKHFSHFGMEVIFVLKKVV